MRMIDADALVEKSFCTAPATMNNPYGGDSVVLVDDIEKAPTIDPESLRPTAEWVYNTDDFTPKKRCTHCGYNKPIAAGEAIHQEPSNYCPNCGAKMKGGTP